ncbi:TAM domain methyltransferase [Colletotrichum musicola]|uniref:TAM domain methyltransferase n=1 Tax=Colletotrichum musicola TaxID=2175873 RepID=A0A8H6NCC1_9PEZI|nr:TAM domain methyltransferase [Colletotrichum musicola]
MTEARAQLTSPGKSSPAGRSSPSADRGSPAGSPAGQQPFEVDDAASSDGYETGGDTSSNAATSLSSSCRDYNFENKRRYHKYAEGQYVMPNDDIEQEREDMKHAMVIQLCDGSLHNAPLDNPQKILDIGTGTGIWAMDVGDEYPEAEVIGLDLSPIQPSFVPPNVSFVVDDVEAEWLYPENSIDYIHIRHMAPAIKNWPKLLEQAFKALKPGGWVEMQDIVWAFTSDDDTVGPEYQPLRMLGLVEEAFQKFGVDIHSGSRFGELLDATGFVNQVHDAKKVPVGPWPRDWKMSKIGEYCRAAHYDALGAVTNVPFTKGLGWTTAEIEVFLVQVRKDLMNTKFHPYHWYHSYSGQKPLEEK